MSTQKLCCGIDVSQSTLDVSYQNNLSELFYIKVPNNRKGFGEIMRHTGLQYHFVPATGVYYMNFAFYLHALHCAISVINALTIKRYIQMHLERNKNDKKDAKWICKYAIDQQPELWEMPDPLYFQCKQLYNAIRTYSGQIKLFTNQIHSLEKLPVQNKDVVKSLEKMMAQLEDEIEKLEKKLQEILEQWQPQQVKNISSIMSVGKRATALLIVYTQGFKYTKNYRQLISFSGLSPVEKSSGTSIHSRSKICRQGGKEIRKVCCTCVL